VGSKILLRRPARSERERFVCPKVFRRRTSRKALRRFSTEIRFNGRTMGTQLLGGSSQPDWNPWRRHGLPSISYPDGYYSRTTTFAERSLSWRANRHSDDIRRVHRALSRDHRLLAPRGYMQELRGFCSDHGIILDSTKSQSGFGRTGRLFAYHHFDIRRNCYARKALSGALPVRPSVGEAELWTAKIRSRWDQHAANPLCLASSLASLHCIASGELCRRGRQLGEELPRGLRRYRPCI